MWRLEDTSPCTWAAVLGAFHRSSGENWCSLRGPKATTGSPWRCGRKQQAFVSNHSKPRVHLNDIQKFSSYLTKANYNHPLHYTSKKMLVLKETTFRSIQNNTLTILAQKRDCGLLLISWSYTHLGPGLSWSMENSKGWVRWRDISGVDTSRRVAVASITCSQYDAQDKWKFRFRWVISDYSVSGIIKIEMCKILKSYARGGQTYWTSELHRTVPDSHKQMWTAHAFHTEGILYWIHVWNKELTLIFSSVSCTKGSREPRAAREP